MVENESTAAIHEFIYIIRDKGDAKRSFLYNAGRK